MEILLHLQKRKQLLLWQYRTKSVWRLCTPSACKFSVIFHKNAREYIQYSLRFLFHLTKNLTTHLSHNLCVVLPCVSIITICGKNICQNLLHHFRTMCLNLRRQGGQSGEGAFPVSLAKKSERVPVFGEHALISTSSDIPPAHAAIPECTVLRHGWSVSWGWRSSRSPCVPPYPAARKQCRRRSGRH